jgi:hypothetical protein
MAQESESGASRAAAPAIETVLRQKTREGETSFTFHPDRLDYTFIGRRGTRVERHIAWNVVPPRSQLRRNARPDLPLHRGSRWAIILLIFASVTRLSTHVSPLVLFTGYAVLLWGLTLLFSRRFRITSSVLPTGQGNIVILGDAAHDAILSRILEGRRAYLRRFAVIDRNQLLRWNLQRLRWMFEQDVIARDDFVRAQQTLLPGVREPLLRPAPDVGPDLKIEQRFCNALFAFDFKTDHLAHRRRTGLGVERAITVKYLDLREPTTAVQVGTPSQLLRSTIFGLVLIGFGYVLEMLERLPSDALAGPDGLQRGLLLLGPGIGAIALAMVAASRAMRMVYTKLPRDIMILRNRQHDAVVAEISRRRRAALKALAEPNPLLGPQEQANLLAALRREGILGDQDIPDILARAAALQKYLGLADPEPQQDRPLQSETPTPPAPRPTIH